MKEKCSNHPGKEAIAPCHSCGKYFCFNCLNEGKEYYYCKADQCQAILREEILRSEEVEEKKKAYFEKGWKENRRRFYRKIILILSIAWILLTVFLFLLNPSHNKYSIFVLPLGSLRICASCFLLVWFIRSIYDYFVWKTLMSQELPVNLSQAPMIEINHDQSIEEKQERIAEPFNEQLRRVTKKIAKIFGGKIY